MDDPALVKFDASREITVLDVLAEFQGGELDASAFWDMPFRQLFELIERLTDFYATWCPATVGSEEIRMSLADTALLPPALLYSNSVAIPDQVFDWLIYFIGPELSAARQFRHGKLRFENAHRQELGRVVSELQAWKPLADKGWVIPVPVRAEMFYGFRALLRSPERDPALFAEWEWFRDKVIAGEQLTPTETKIVMAGFANHMALKEAEKDDELIRAMDVRPDEIAPVVDIYVRAFSQASAAQARPLATGHREWAYYLHRLRVVGQALRRDDKVGLSIVPALAASDLPFISDVTPKVLADIRTDESAFAEWQLCISKAVRMVEALPADEFFAEEASTVLKEALLPAAEQVRRVTSKSRSLGVAAKDSMLRLGLGAAVGGGAVQAGLPVEYAASSAGLSALIDLTVKAILSPSASGSQAILAKLIQNA
jgi:hypothetical protein